MCFFLSDVTVFAVIKTVIEVIVEKEKVSFGLSIYDIIYFLTIIMCQCQHNSFE